MPTRKASAEWNGELKTGQGKLKSGSGVISASYNFDKRFGEEPGTNPEELMGASLAACYAMALSAELGKAGLKPENIKADADVEIAKQGDAFAVTHIDLKVNAHVPGADQAKFQSIAEAVKKNCPVAKALAGTTINLKASLV